MFPFNPVRSLLKNNYNLICENIVLLFYPNYYIAEKIFSKIFLTKTSNGVNQKLGDCPVPGGNLLILHLI